MRILSLLHLFRPEAKTRFQSKSFIPQPCGLAVNEALLSSGLSLEELIIDDFDLFNYVFTPLPKFLEAIGENDFDIDMGGSDKEVYVLNPGAAENIHKVLPKGFDCPSHKAEILARKLSEFFITVSGEPIPANSIEALFRPENAFADELNSIGKTQKSRHFIKPYGFSMNGFSMYQMAANSARDVEMPEGHHLASPIISKILWRYAFFHEIAHLTPELNKLGHESHKAEIGCDLYSLKSCMKTATSEQEKTLIPFLILAYRAAQDTTVGLMTGKQDYIHATTLFLDAEIREENPCTLEEAIQAERVFEQYLMEQNMPPSI